MFDIISIGDSTIDTIMEIDESLKSCKTMRTSKGIRLCLSYPDKIPVAKMTKTVAGNATNNAIGCARLGLNVAINTIIGDDDSGDWIIHKLKKENVSLAYVEQNKKCETNTSTVIDYKDDRTILVYHAERTYKLPKLDKSNWIYYTSVGKNHLEYNKQIVKHVKKTGSKLAYNPGTHQLKSEKTAMLPILSVCEILFVNKEEARIIAGKKSTIKKYLEKLRSLGPKVVVITDGERGSYSYDGIDYLRMDIVEGNVIEKTGAGDAYASAFISAISCGKTIFEAMQWGAINGLSVAEQIGPQAGLLNLSEIEKRAKKNKVKPEKI